jgi:methionine synthase I (cobalamin-dependent)
MRTSLADLLSQNPVLLADGATGTNFMGMGLGPGEPPELWNVDCPEKVVSLHQSFVDAGADIILTNSFGGNANRLALHHNEHRVHELNVAAAKVARDVADACSRPVVVAGSVGPTGALFEPMGPLTHDEAVRLFTEQMEGLRDGGVDVLWIETMSAVEELQAAAVAAIAVGMPYAATASFDTAGKTMMGVHPNALAAIFELCDEKPVAIGANCGVGASDILVTISHIDAEDNVVITKGNCGIPQFVGAEIHYSGTPELMEKYGRLAVHSGARIIGGCCGTSAEHLAAIRRGIDAAAAEIVVTGRTPPSVEDIEAATGKLTHKQPTATEGRARRSTSRR